MKKRNKKIKISLLVTAFVTFVSLFGLATNVSAANWNAKFTRGISRVSYYIDYNSGTGYYEYLIIDAEHNWENPGWTSPVNMVAASSNAGTMLDIYTKDSSFWGGNTNILGETHFYNNNGTDLGVPYNTNYVFTRIYLNDTSMHNNSATNDRHVIIHEMGHCFGLAHNNNPNSIMYPSINGSNVHYVQQVDVNDLTNLYQ